MDKESLTSSAFKLDLQIALANEENNMSMECLRRQEIFSVMNHEFYDCSISKIGEKIVTVCRNGYFRLWWGIYDECKGSTQINTTAKISSCWLSRSGNSAMFLSKSSKSCKSKITVYSLTESQPLRRYQKSIDERSDRLRVSPDQNLIRAKRDQACLFMIFPNVAA